MARTATQADFETAMMLLDNNIPATKVSKLLGYATGTLYFWKKQKTWEKHEADRIAFAQQQKDRAAAEAQVETETAPAESYATPAVSEEKIENTGTVIEKLDRIIELLENAITPVDRKVTTRSDIAKHLFR